MGNIMPQLLQVPRLMLLWWPAIERLHLKLTALFALNIQSAM